MKKILILAATHGNEPLGIEVAARLRAQGLADEFDMLVANPRALERGVRFTDTDLNRSYPGDSSSSSYEIQRAAENYERARRYSYCLDIHEASASTDDFIISPREALDTTFPIETIDLERVILWPEPKGPLGGILANTIELEFGTRNRDRIELVNTASRIVEQCMLSIKKGTTKTNEPKSVFKVIGTIGVDDLRYTKNNLCDFERVDDTPPWFPLLTDQYLREGIRCYRMIKYEQSR